MLFSDRLEVWNPGELPPPLTMAQLRLPHASIPRNPLICDPMFLARYVEKAGSGTLDMIALCREAGLPEPEFCQDGGQFVQVIWRDWLSGAVMDELGLNERQRQAIAFVRTKGRIYSADYQHLTGASRQTASRDLDQLVEYKLLNRHGKGRGIYYMIVPRMPQK